MIEEFFDRQAADADLYELEDAETGEKKQVRIVSKAAVTQEGTPLNKATFDPILADIRSRLSASAVADYVEEQGTSGYWTYRKWKSGLSEGWFRNSYASLSFGDETGSGALFQYARYNLTLALPTSAAVFVESPRTVLAAASRGTSVYPFGAFVNTRSSTTVDVVLWSAIGGALPNVSVELYAVGRWK